MEYDYVIKNGRVIDPAAGVDGIYTYITIESRTRR